MTGTEAPSTPTWRRRGFVTASLTAGVAASVIVAADAGAADAARIGLQTVLHGRPKPAMQMVERWQTVCRQLGERLRPATRVVEGTVPKGSWHQRLIECAVLNGLTVVAKPDSASAAYRIAIVPEAPGALPPAGLLITRVAP